MKITGVSAAGLSGATPPGGWENELNPEDDVHTLIAVHTDEGQVGLGSVFTSSALVRGSLEVLRPLLLGASAVQPERVCEDLHRATFWMGRGGAITHTISGVDQALWDLMGKIAGLPVSCLLGGRRRERVRPYASLLMDEPEPMCDQLRELLAKGFRSFKIGWGPFGRRSAGLDRAIVAAARETVGAECELMVDAGASDSHWPHGYKWALSTARMLAEYDVAWFEEPLRPDCIEDYVLLRQHSAVPISGGEVLTRRQSFGPWISHGAVDVIQPDVTKCGGISEIHKIAWQAHDRGIRLIPHGWNTAVGLAADLQLAAALPDTDRVEYVTGSPYVDDLAGDRWHLDDEGTLEIPDAPGLGIELDSDALAALADNPALLTRS
ncbi:mandelate racemase/muconate lactonizing enzyme family protein [Ornithinicoccus halotolerans]|uniref:mandelate racemase/muconate lactonizing enzyme family protein n=1 Tax=Ornithinicoccus halotolerans TaxID=1748220 RepID=UPI0012968B76|nr:mandelate racemase/muconate lactonizing enzyme family protein [Ornithinicoccus halotolerans]